MRIVKASVLMLILLITLFVCSFTFAAPSAVNDQYSPLILSDTNLHYPLASVAHSSGFVVIDKQAKLPFAPQMFTASDNNYGLTPDFSKHHRYWLMTRIVNKSEQENWFLHISNFGFEHSKVMLRSDHGQMLYFFDGDSGKNSVDINAIGRAVSVRLQPGESYQVIVELNANHVVWHPYIALIAAPEYQQWNVGIDYAFKLAIGVILGMVLLGWICWIQMGERTFFWGALSSLLLLCFYLEHSSLPAELWQYSYRKTDLFWVLISLSQLSLFTFAAHFLGIKRDNGLWFNTFVGVGLVTIFLMLIAPLISLHTKVVLYALNYLLLWAVILSSGIAKVRSEGRYYIMYILGWMPLMASMLQVIWFVLLPSPPPQVVEVSYKIIHVLYIHILYMIIHVVALVQRVRVMRIDKRKAEKLSHAKSRFIAQSSHDLRQPLHSMYIFLEYLKPHIRKGEAQVIYERLLKTHMQMNDSFNAIMDLSKLEAGAIRADMRPVLLQEIFNKIHQDFSYLAHYKNIKFSIVTTSAWVYTDSVLLERILRNLVSNAIKYTDTGGVVLGCRRRGQELSIQIWDSGRGIALGEQDTIFDIYQRSGQQPEQVDGSGIGLSIVKHLLVLLNHPLSFSSQLGKGSVFQLQLPRLNANSIVASQTEATSAFDGLRVAIAVQNKALTTELNDRLLAWHHNVILIDDVSGLFDIASTVDLILIDDHYLKQAALNNELLIQIALTTVCAYLSDSEYALPVPWTSLRYPVLPTQLRALLNFAGRSARVNEAPQMMSAKPI